MKSVQVQCLDERMDIGDLIPRGIARLGLTAAVTKPRQVGCDYLEMGRQIFCDAGPVIFVCCKAVQQYKDIAFTTSQVSDVMACNIDLSLLKIGGPALCLGCQCEERTVLFAGLAGLAGL